MQNPGRLIASMFALCAFTVALIAGLAAENQANIVLRHAILAMLVGYVVALGVASVARSATRTAPEGSRRTSPALESTPEPAPSAPPSTT